jgi:Helix-turn-helix
MPATERRQVRPSGKTPVPDWVDARLAANLSIKEVSDITGINQGIVSMIERRIMHPNPQQARAILDCYAAGQREPTGFR